MKNRKHSAAVSVAPPLLAAAALLAACNQADDATPVMVAPEVLQIEVVSGDQQVGAIDSALDDFLIARVRTGGAGGAGTPVSDVLVRWTILEGEATIFAKRPRTDPQGLAVGSVFLGDEVGEIIVQAAIEDGPAVEFNIQATDLPEGTI